MSDRRPLASAERMRRYRNRKRNGLISVPRFDIPIRDRALASRVGKLRLSKAWKDVGALKAELRDLWVQERNSLAKRVVQDVEQQRKVRK